MQSVTETVIGEISRSLDFYAATTAESRINKVYLSGGSAKVSGLEAAFRERTGLDVETLNPLSRMLPSDRFDQEYLDDMSAALSVGVGLALREADAR
jgi:type IV pilus assembly protein PilM